MLKDKKKRIIDCGEAVFEVMTTGVVTNREIYKERMLDLGWEVVWGKGRHIYYVDTEGNRVKDSMILKYTGIDATKEGVLEEFLERLSVQIAFHEQFGKEAANGTV